MLAVDDDLQRWSNDPASMPRSRTRWLFGGEGCWNTGSIRFLVVDMTGYNICSVVVHQNLALILAYLDLDYWLTPIAQDMTAWNQKRIEHYLRLVRDDVVTELAAADGVTLLQSSFGPTALRQWAVRVRHTFGHSQTGRSQYRDFCTAKGHSPYDEQYINYGEITNLPAV
jgi:hypothetical protein